MKKTFIILSVLFGVALLFWGAYNFAFKKDGGVKKDAQSEAESTRNADELLSEKKQQGRIYPLTDNAVLGAVFDKKKEKIIYYSASDGTTWQIDPDGKGAEQISDKKLPGLRSIHWTADRSKVISEIEKEGRRTFYVYDFSSGKATEIKKEADLIAWDNTGSRIVYKYFDEKAKRRSLNAADQDGSNWKVLVDGLAFRKISLGAVPQTSLLSFWNYPSSGEETSLQTVSMLGGEAKTVLAGRFGADYLWSPDGTKALVSSLGEKGGKKISLGTVELSGRYADLGIPTFVRKCAWSQDKKAVYCALPGSVPENAVLPDDYQEGKFRTQDTFWKIDISTGEKERVLELAEMKEGYDAYDLFLSSSEDALFFTNLADGKLYRIDL